MDTINIDIAKTQNFITAEEIKSYQSEIEKHLDDLHKKTGKGSDFFGWLDLPFTMDKQLIDEINKVGGILRKKADVIVVIGIGGSYLGARAVIEALSHNFHTMQTKMRRNKPIIVYAGQNISEDYLADLMDILNKRQYAIIVISKSGTTIEPAIAFRILKNHLVKKYGTKKAKKRIVVITDKTKGALKQISLQDGYYSFVIPDDVGGRYSVLTPVGLLPIASAGFNIKKLLKGAKTMAQICSNTKIEENPSALYAVVRNILYKKGNKIEILGAYLPCLYYFIEWWKQLFGESEGKQGKGIFPTSAIFSTDLHSLGQYIQEGERHLFETILSVDETRRNLIIPEEEKNLDGLNYIAGKKIHEISKIAELGTQIAHVEGGVPNIKISLPRLDEEYLGQLIYFFENACAISGYLLGVNPFDQPGVEAYKKNMFALLGKPS